MDRQARIDQAITAAVRESRRLKSEWAGKPLEIGDSIHELDVRTGQESPGNWSRIPEALVEQRHIDAADKADGS